MPKLLGVVIALTTEDLEEIVQCLDESRMLWPDHMLDGDRLARRCSLTGKVHHASQLVAEARKPPASG